MCISNFTKAQIGYFGQWTPAPSADRSLVHLSSIKVSLFLCINNYFHWGKTAEVQASKQTSKAYSNYFYLSLNIYSIWTRI